MNDLIENPLFLAVAFGAVVLFAAVKLLWGAAQWAKKPQHRIGDRWGSETVEVVEWSDGAGYVTAGGELWRAVSKEALRPGDRVVVSKSKGLTLEVRKG